MRIWHCSPVLLFLAGCMSIEPSQVTGQPGLSLRLEKQQKPDTCGSVCLAAVLDYWGESVSLDVLESELGEAPLRGYHLCSLQQVARARGLEAFLFSGRIEDLEVHTAAERPCIVVYRVRGSGNHCAVVTGIEGDQLLLMNPRTGGLKRRRVDEFMAAWEAVESPILLVAPRAEQKDKKAV